MTITYPLSLPTVPVTDSTWRLVCINSQSVSPFTGAQQTYLHPGVWWEGQITFKPVLGQQAGNLRAFLTSLNGMSGTFLMGDPDNLAKGNRGVATTGITVSGAGQTGSTLVLTGFAPSTAGVLCAGDYLQIGSAANAKLHQVLETVASDGSGTAVISVAPPLRSSPVDGGSVILVQPRGVFRLSEPTVEWSSGPTAVQSVTLAFREAL